MLQMREQRYLAEKPVSSNADRQLRMQNLERNGSAVRVFREKDTRCAAARYLAMDGVFAFQGILNDR